MTHTPEPGEGVQPPDGVGGRLHPAVMLIWPLSQIAPLVVIWLIGTLPLGLVVVVSAVSIGAAIIRWQRFRWQVAGGALVIEQGLLQRQRRVIPLERIQAVDIVRRLRHRPFGVVELRAEAVGGATTEGVLDALAVHDAQELRALLLRARDQVTADGVEPQQGPERLLARMRFHGLVLAGVTGGRVGVAAAVLGGAQQLFGQRLAAWLERLLGVVGVRGLLGAVFLIAVGAFLLSVIATTLAYWGFTLTREGDALRVRRGLLEQRSEVLPLRRIQAVRVEENAVRRLLGLATVKVDVAGRSGESGHESSVLLPLGRRAEAFQLAEAVFERPELAGVDLAPAPVGARTRRVVRAVAGTAVVTAAVAATAWPVGLLAVAVVVPALGAARSAYAALGHAHLPGMVVTRFGLVVRRTAFVPTSRLHSLALVASPFQRRRGLATLELHIPRSPGAWGGPQVVDLAEGAGWTLLERLAVVAAR